MAPLNQACFYDINKYLNVLGCSNGTGYGYKTGNPCVLVKLNNVIKNFLKIKNEIEN